MARRFPWWIPAALFFLIPVIKHGTGSLGTPSGPGGPLLKGECSLDSLLAAAGEKPVLLNFWATWCGPCVHELPVLDSLYGEYSGRADFAAVSLGDPSIAALESFLGGNPVVMPVVPTSPRVSPVFTSCPTLTRILSRWAYTVYSRWP